MTTKLNADELHPLKWPEGWDRTRINDRKRQGGWKRTTNQYTIALCQELSRMGVTEAMLSYNIDAQLVRQDCGVAIYFSRSINDQFSWQEALGIDSPAPTLAEIDDAYRKLAMPHHPDRIAQTGKGDPAVFAALTAHRDKAKAWVRGEHTKEHEYVIACDMFEEVRWNICALKQIIHALRQLERFGSPAVLERTFRGFKAALPAHTMEASHAAIA